MSEFDLIRRHFIKPTPGALLGIGDDAALLMPSAGNALAVSSDMLVAGTHFFHDADPFMLGHKALAVNLSDMAAMGAKPRWVTLAIALPEADEAWLAGFSAGFFSLAKLHGVELVGGDTTRGPLNLSVTIMGEVPQGQSLLRSGAEEGDEIWISGNLGDAALALAHIQGKVALHDAKFAAWSPALHQPQPRVTLGFALRGIAKSAIDISDGLLADMGHILEASNVAAQLDYSALPTSDILRDFQPLSLAKQCILSGGDDYELCFTADVKSHEKISAIGVQLGLKLTCIGGIVPGQGCVVQDGAGINIDVKGEGYDHFR
ncbi:MAG: thiamine-phosphate kinase [Gallionella sp.]